MDEAHTRVQAGLAHFATSFARKLSLGAPSQMKCAQISHQARRILYIRAAWSFDQATVHHYRHVRLCIRGATHRLMPLPFQEAGCQRPLNTGLRFSMNAA